MGCLNVFLRQPIAYLSIMPLHVSFYRIKRLVTYVVFDSASIVISRLRINTKSFKK